MPVFAMISRFVTVTRAFQSRQSLAVAPAIAFAMLIFATLTDANAHQHREQARQFVKIVLLSTKFDGELKTVTRWVKPFTLQIIDARQEDEVFIASFVERLNRLLSGSGVRIRIKDDNKSEAAIMFARNDEFQRIADYLGVEYAPGSTGFNWLWADERSQTDFVFALVGSGQETRRRKTTIVQEIFHILGLPGHSSLFPDSVLYESGEMPSNATKLAPIDRKLLRFLYFHLKPGDDIHAVRRAFDKYWSSIPSD